MHVTIYKNSIPTPSIPVLLSCKHGCALFSASKEKHFVITLGTIAIHISVHSHQRQKGMLMLDILLQQRLKILSRNNKGNTQYARFIPFYFNISCKKNPSVICKSVTCCAGWLFVFLQELCTFPTAALNPANSSQSTASFIIFQRC